MLGTAKALSVVLGGDSEPGRDGVHRGRSAALGGLLAVACALVACSAAQAALRTTEASVDCGPAVVVAQSATCTVTVTDSDTEGTPSPPEGTVSFTSDPEGTFNPVSCKLGEPGEKEASCQVAYEPTAVGSGTHEITAAYGGDSVHEISSGSGVLAVAARTTVVSLDCGPAVVVAQSATCTATVTDSDTEGTPSPPKGTVSFTSDSQGAFTPTTCEPSQSGEAQSSCSVKYEPAAVGSGTHKITGAYLGDPVHTASSSSAALTVNPAPVASQGGGTTTTTTTTTTAPGPVVGAAPGPVIPRVTPKCRVKAKERWKLVGRARRHKLAVPELVVTYTCDQTAAVLVGGAVRIAAIRHDGKLTKPRTVKLPTVSAKAVLGKAQPGVVLAIPAVAAKALRKDVRTEATVTFTVKNANGTGIGTIKFLILPPARVTHKRA